MKQLLLLPISFSFLLSCGANRSTTGNSGGSSKGAKRVKSSVAGRDYRDHKISFSQGQKQKITLDAGGATCYFNVITPSGETIFNGANDGKNFTGTMSFTGSYT